MTTLYVDNIAPNLQSKISAPNLTLPTGSVVQVVSTPKIDTFTMSSQTFTDITGLSVAFTPKAATNKILITGFISVGINYDATVVARIKKEVNGAGSVFGSPAAANQRSLGHSTLGYMYLGGNNADRYEIQSLPINFLHTLSSSDSTTIKMQIANGDASGQSVFVNRSEVDVNAVWNSRGTSQLTIQEIAG